MPTYRAPPAQIDGAPVSRPIVVIGAQSADGHTGASVRGASTAGFGFGIFGQLLAPAMPDIKLPLVRHKEGCRKRLAEA
jgi:hypothetical protein